MRAGLRRARKRRLRQAAVLARDAQIFLHGAQALVLGPGSRHGVAHAFTSYGTEHLAPLAGALFLDPYGLR